jgi:hypothetical protein
MRRVIDVILIALFLGAVGFGAYEIGHRVDRESNSLSSQDPELNTTTVASGKHSSKSRETPIIVAGALGGAVVLILLGSAVSAVGRGRKREHWRAG